MIIPDYFVGGIPTNTVNFHTFPSILWRQTNDGRIVHQHWSLRPTLSTLSSLFHGCVKFDSRSLSFFICEISIVRFELVWTWLLLIVLSSKSLLRSRNDCPRAAAFQHFSKLFVEHNMMNMTLWFSIRICTIWKYGDDC